jgi:hypothetical protein
LISFSIAPMPPAAPVFVSVTPGSSSLILVWSAPTGTGVEVSDYGVQYSQVPATPTDPTTWSTVAHTASTALTSTITGLTNGVAYQVGIRAGNSTNSSAWVVASGTYTPFTVPSLPQGITVTPTDASSLALVTWTASASTGGSAITGYTVSADPGTTLDAIKSCSVGAGTYQCTISSITNKIPYTVSVVATNSAGNSAPASSASAMTLAATNDHRDAGRPSCCWIRGADFFGRPSCEGVKRVARSIRHVGSDDLRCV